MMSLDDEIRKLNQSNLKPRAKSLYLAFMELACKETTCSAILSSLAYKSGMSESTVIRTIKELEAGGFISVARAKKVGPSTAPNVYKLLQRGVQHSQIDGTGPVKLTDKTLNKIEDTADSLTTNTACHHDTRGGAPGVMDDRLQENVKIQDILKKYEDPPSQEAEITAVNVVELIGLEGLDTELRTRRVGQPVRTLHWDLEEILWEQRNASLKAKEAA